jgi:5-hydroxyisourate hydrolase
MSRITTHVLDTVLGKPAVGVAIRLERHEQEIWIEVAQGQTDSDGRCGKLAPEVTAGFYRLTFQTGEYLSRLGRASLYPEIAISFQCGIDAHYHLPLLLSDNSYTTYRGS